MDTDAVRVLMIDLCTINENLTGFRARQYARDIVAAEAREDYILAQRLTFEAAYLGKEGPDKAMPAA